MQDAVLVLSKSRRFSWLIARTLRCRQVYCIPAEFGLSIEEIRQMNPRGVIIASESLSPEEVDASLLELDMPLLFLSGAAVWLCRHFGGQVGQELGQAGAVTLDLAQDQLFEEIEGGERILHGARELLLPEGLLPLATATQQVIGFKHGEKPLYALQYQIERNDPDGAQLLYNFACNICGCQEEWTEDNMIAHAVERLRQAAPEGRVLCAVSGGVDSAVCAKLASMAVGNRLVCVFVDTGLFRQGEPDRVIHTFMDSLGLAVAHVDARETFLRALSGVSGWDDKERIASQLMTQVLKKQLIYDPDIHTLVMGTNYNDALAGFSSELDDGKLTICEPIRLFFKDEVRRLGTALGLPDAIVHRQPFPSSGLALRVMGVVTEERLEYLRTADACFTEEICQGGYDRRLWQYYANLVESPDRPHSYAICLRAVQAQQDGGVAARMPADVLERTTRRIMEELPCVSRVVYDLTPSAHYGELE